MFTILANDPSCQEKLRKEVKESFEDGSYTCARPQNMLDGVISETLRICPPVLFAPQRMVPEGGIRIGDVEIPGGTILSFSTYNFHHGKPFITVLIIHSMFGTDLYYRRAQLGRTGKVHSRTLDHETRIDP